MKKKLFLVFLSFIVYLSYGQIGNEEITGDSIQSYSNSCDQPCVEGTAHTLYYSEQDIYTQEYMYGGSCTHRLENTCNGTSLYVYKRIWSGSANYRDSDNDWDANPDKPGATALWCLQMIYDFFWTLGQNSISLTTPGLDVTIRANCTSPSNYWDPVLHEINVISSDGNYFNDAATLDLIGHEFMEGMIDLSPNLMGPEGETGAIKESFCDIFGTMVEFYAMSLYSTGRSPDYEIGSECYDDDGNGNYGAIRFMYNPGLKGHADCYGCGNWVNPQPGMTSHKYIDAGVLNYWFYLLAEGSGGPKINCLGSSYCITGIGRDKATNIAWNTLKILLMNYSNPSYYDVMSVSIHWTEDSYLYGPNSNELAQLTNAWYAVGVLDDPYTGPIIVNHHTVSGTETMQFSNEVLFNNLFVPAGTSFTVTSDTRITMKSTSRASSGSYFHAFIAPGCTGGAKSFEIPYNTISNEEEQEIQNTGLSESNPGLLVYPNPSQGIFTIQFSKEMTGNSSVIIADVPGNIVYEKLLDGSLSQQINTGELAGGMYFLRIENEGITFFKTIVIQE